MCNQISGLSSTIDAKGYRETSLVRCLMYYYSCCTLVILRGNQLVIFPGIACTMVILKLICKISPPPQAMVGADKTSISDGSCMPAASPYGKAQLMSVCSGRCPVSRPVTLQGRPSCPYSLRLFRYCDDRMAEAEPCAMVLVAPCRL